MKTIYDNLNITFDMENVSFTVINIAKEQFLAPVPKHIHGNDCYELHYISQGHGIVNINGTAYSLAPNTLYFTIPHMEHEQIPFPSDPFVEYSVFFIAKKKSNALSFFTLITSDYERVISLEKNSSKIHEIFYEIFKEFQFRQKGWHLQVIALLQQLILTAMRYLPDKVHHAQIEQCPSPESCLNDERVFITDKAFLYEYSTLSLNTLSGYLNLSTRQTNRFLSQHYGKNFSQKLLDARMSAAAVLLSRPELSILEISARVGYTSMEYFSALFKKYYDISPRKYRESLNTK